MPARTLLLPLVSALLVVALACGSLPSERQQSSQVVETAAPVSPSETFAPAPTVETAAQSVQLERVKTAASDVRELPPLAPVSTTFVPQHELRKLVVELFDRDYLPTEQETDQRLLVALGLLEAERSIVQEWLDLYEEQVAGMYDDETKQLYVIAAAPSVGPEERVTFAHEYIHALQDQHFNLGTLMPKHSDNQDRSRAIQGLVEGDATLAMALYASRELTRDELAALGRSASSSRLAQAPLILRTELLFPYTDGLRFVRRLHSRGGFAAINQAFANPPQSSEQVLHPEKYDQREAPEAVSLPDLSSVAGEDWRHLNSNVLGELYLRTIIEQFSAGEVARSAAAGWGGDRWQLLAKGDQTALVVRTLWDTEGDAREFLTAYGDALQVRFPGAQMERREGRMRLSAPDTWVSTQLHGRQVDVVTAPEHETGERLVTALQ